MSNEVKNYYEVLEVPSNARTEEIYHSYQRAKAAYSTDSLALYSLMSPEECRNVLELVEEAYSILSDPMKRKRYDEARGFNRDFPGMNYTPDRIVKNESTSGASVTKILRDEYNVQSQSNVTSTDSKVSTNPSSATNVTKLVTAKRFALDYVVNPDFEKEIEDATEYNGDFLRRIREYKSVDLERLSDMTKVSKLYLQAIEMEDFDKLPAAVYVRGFVFQYAKCLKLKPEIVANSFVARMKKLKP